MSKRAVKKLQQRAVQKTPNFGQNEQQQDDSEEDGNDNPIIKPQQQKKNLFQMFNDDESEGEENNSENEKNEKQEPVNSTQAQSKKKKKKNKKKGKKAQEEDEEKQEEDDKFFEELDKFTGGQKYDEEHKIDEDDHFNQNNGDSVKLRSILEIKLNMLDYNKEISKYFKGAKLSDDRSMEGLTANEKKKLRYLNGRQFKNHKSYYLSYHQKPITIRQQFEKLLCEQVGTNEIGQKVFAFVPTQKYDHLQESYESLKNTLDPNNIFEFLNQNPFHIDAQYDVGEYFRLKGDYKQANQLLEQILYIYEESFSYEFSRILQDTDNQICLSVNHNKYSKTLFNTVHKFIDILGKKGCYKSALEYNKFLIKLNPLEDPTGALLTLDYQAISAQQYNYLIYFTKNFCREIYKSDEKTLLFLPNYIFSCALGKFKQALFTPFSQKKQKQSSNANIGGSQPDESEILKQLITFTDQDFQDSLDCFQKGKNHLNHNQNVLLLTAILLYPNAMVGLVNTVEMQKQVVSHSILKEWQKKSLKDIIAHKFFSDVSHSPIYSFLQLQNDKDVEGLNKLIEIYLERSKLIWKHNNITLWVKAAMGFILNKIENLDGSNFNYTDFIEALYTNDCGKVIPFRLQRYVQLTKSNFSDNEQQFDVNNIQDDQQFQMQQEIQQQMQQQNNPLNLNQNFLSLLFSSLMPWNNLPNPNNNNQQQQQLNIPQNQHQLDQMMQQLGLTEQDLQDAQLAEQMIGSDEEDYPDEDQ